MCFKESYFPDCRKVSSVVPVFNDVVRGLWLKTPKLINGLVDNLEECSLLSAFQDGLRFSRFLADLLTVVSDRIAWAFDRSEATRAVALDIFKAFDRVFFAIHRLKLY